MQPEYLPKLLLESRMRYHKVGEGFLKAGCIYRITMVKMENTVLCALV